MKFQQRLGIVGTFATVCVLGYVIFNDAQEHSTVIANEHEINAADVFSRSASAQHFQPADLNPVCKVEEIAKADVYSEDILQGTDTAHANPPNVKQAYEYSLWKEPKKDPITVIYVPFSHIDPGWLKTFDQYVAGDISQILSGMVETLLNNPQWTYSISEMCVLEAWMKKATLQQVRALKTLASRKQLEVTTGAWVMTDEASPTYHAILDQMIEGQTWAKSTLGVNITAAWSIDPFGQSSTMPYLLAKSAMKGMVINRIHQFQKKYLAERQALEFIWRQPWDKKGEFDIYTHVLPNQFYTYNEQCGPDEKICKKTLFDRERNINITELSAQLVDQYKKKSSLFRHNVVLVIYGRDFSFTNKNEWTYSNKYLPQVFDYINSNQRFGCHARFGTLAEYFELATKYIKDNKVQLPVITGDFFPYSDSSTSYWTGYYTTRPHLKRVGRDLQRLILAADVLLVQKFPRNPKLVESITQLLTSARRALGLFLHHDAITGTSLHEVMDDYLSVLLGGVRNATVALTHLTYPSDESTDNKIPFAWDSLLVPVLDADKPQVVVLFNPSHFPKTEIIRVAVNTLCLSVVDDNGKIPLFQTNNVIGAHNKMSETEYELLILLELPPMRHRYIYVTYEDKLCPSKGNAASLQVLKVDERGTSSDRFATTSFDVRIDNSTTILTVGHKKVNVSIFQWETVRGGAYLFAKALDPMQLKINSDVWVIDGALQTDIFVNYGLVHQRITFPKAGVFKGELLFTNLCQVNLVTGTFKNREWSMDLRYFLGRNPTLYTDSNGFQMMRRKYMPKLLVEANVNPITSLAYLDDGCNRMSLYSRQPHGVLQAPKLQRLNIFLDRQLRSQDGKGMAESVKDNVPTVSEFLFRFESRQKDKCFDMGSLDNDNKTRLSFESLSSAVLNELYQKPVLVSVHSEVPSSVKEKPKSPHTWSACDIVPVLQRTFNVQPNQVSFGFILRKLQHDCTFPMDKKITHVCVNRSGKVNLQHFFESLKLSRIWKSSLTFMHRYAFVSAAQPDVDILDNLEAFEVLINMPQKR